MDVAKLKEKTIEFFDDDIFIVVSALIVFIGHTTGLWHIFLCVLAVFCALPLFFTKSNKCLLTFFLQFTFIISKDRHELGAYWWLLFLLIPILSGVVFQTVKYAKTYDWAQLNPKNASGHFFFLFLLILPFAFGGIARTHERPLVVFLAFVIILLIALVYGFFIVSNKNREGSDLLPSYVLKNLLAIGVLISVQMIVYYIRIGSIDEILHLIKYKNHDLGWGGPNNIGTIYALTIPSAFYFCSKKSKFTALYATLAFIEVALLITTGSRGAIFVVILALLPMILYTMAITPSKKAFGLSISLLFAIFVLFVIWQADKIIPTLADRFALGLSSNGRLETEYPAALDAFKKYPIFGAGWDYLMNTKVTDGYTPYWFHSTVLQVAATMGTFGLIFFLLWIFQKYRLFALSIKDTRAVYLCVSTILFGAYCMVDTGFFAPTFFIMNVIISFSCEVVIPNDKCLALPRLLFKNKNKEETT